MRMTDMMALVAAVPLRRPVAHHSYPLSGDAYHYLKRIEGLRSDRLQERFPRPIENPEGQAAVRADGKYLPLADEAARAKVDAR